MLYQNILNTIGNTPLVKINNLKLPSQVKLFVKLEGQNPGGSIKDRAALNMFKKAEKNKKVTRHKTILEATSGNMGIALAMLGAYTGYKVKVVMSGAVSLERRTILKSFGAELVLTDPSLGTQGAIQKAKELVKRNPNKHWFADQFNNSDNRQAHFQTALEIFKDLTKVHTIIIGSGTAGTLTGIAKKTKQISPKTKIVAVFPQAGYKIQGIQHPLKDFAGKLFDKKLIDQQLVVSARKARQTARLVARQEGMFLGMSSGAAIYAALKLAKQLKKGNLVVISADRGEKYLSTDLYG